MKYRRIESPSPVVTSWIELGLRGVIHAGLLLFSPLVPLLSLGSVAAERGSKDWRLLRTEECPHHRLRRGLLKPGN